jgi:hypothetical protein
LTLWEGISTSNLSPKDSHPILESKETKDNHHIWNSSDRDIN